ncbi:MAG: aldo/keto reductase [Oscillospiraceae bacterium]|jgi:predicted aldo/keto reductase-like oxidoreductase|nr:aldo/keto reductase [Oscillospiraceae bacterium]
MTYKTFGKTGYKVSAVGFGGMRFKAEEYRDGPEKCAELVLYAKELGINYFDTAPGYCDDMSEIIMGTAFRQMKGGFFVSTKCGLWNAKTADETRARIEKSLKRLHVDAIDFYNMWSIKNMEEYRAYMKKGGIFDGILKAKEEGLIRHVCASTHASGPDIEEIVNDGIIDGVTLGLNAINFAFRRQGVKAAHAAGVGVVVMNPLGGGVIPRHAGRFSFLRKSPDESVAKAALEFLIGQPEITVTLPGISSRGELEENVAAADSAAAVSEAEMDALAGRLREDLDSLCTCCAYCDECPAGIKVPQFMDSYNEKILTGEIKPVKSRLINHWSLAASAAKDCTACGQCEKLCTQKLPIIKRMSEIAAL